MIDLSAKLDSDGIIRQYRRMYEEARKMTSGTMTETEKMDVAMMRFKNTLISTAAQIGGGIGLIQLARQIATTRGEFQQLEVAFTTLLQSKSKADALMSQMVELAAKTPFDLQGVASGARQLLAYGFAADDITDTLTRLGNVAAGLGLPLERLTYLYGTTAVQGRLFTRDMQQFLGSGIDIASEMANTMGKTRDEISQMVTEGKIGFPEVQKAIENMTNQGGKFYNLMQEQSKTINGQISNLKDAIDMMFNEIGKSQEGVINSAISGAAYLVENYEKILKILVPLVATYGAYKASLMAISAVHQAAISTQYADEAAELQKLLTVKEAATNADIKMAIAKGHLTDAQAQNIFFIRAEAAARLDVMRAEATQAAMSVKNAKESVVNAGYAISASRVKLAALREELVVEVESGNVKRINALQEKLNAELKAYGAKQAALKTAQDQLSTAQISAQNKAIAANTMQLQLSDAATKSLTASQRLFAGVTALTTNAVRVLKTSLASFLPTAIIAAVGLLVYKLYEVATAETEAEKAAKRLREANKDFETSVLKETSALNIMFDRLKRAKEGTQEYADAKKAIQDKYAPLLSSMGQEVRSLNNITEAQKALTAAILDTAKARAREGYVGEVASSSASKQGEAITNIRDQLYKNRGEAEGKAILDSIKGILQKYDMGEAGAGTWDELRKVLFDAGIKPSYKSAKNPVADYILEQAKSYSGAARELREANREAEDIWGKIPEKTENQTVVPTITEDLKTATKAYNNAVAAWDKGIKDNLETSVVSKLKQDAEEAKKRLEDIQSALGVDPKAAAKAGADALKAQNDIDDALLKSMLASQKERIDAMQDGKAKELEQIKADKIAKLAAIDQEEREMREKYAKTGQVIPQEQTDTFTVRRKVVTEGVVSQTTEVEKKYAKEIEDLYTQIGSVWLTEEEKKRAEIKKTYDGLREQQKKMLEGGSISQEEYETNVSFINLTEEQEKSKNLLDQYKSYTQQREDIEKKFNDDIAEMQAKNVDGEYDANIEEAKKRLETAIKELNDKIASETERSSSLFIDLFSDMSEKGISEIQSIIDRVQLLQSYLSAEKDKNGNALIKNNAGNVTSTISKQQIIDLGFSESDLEVLSKSPKILKAVQAALKEFKDELADRSPFMTFRNAIENAFKKIDKGGIKNIGEGISEIGIAASNFSPAISEFGNALGSIFRNDEIASGIQDVAVMIDGLGKSAQGVGQIMAGDIVGGVMSLVSGIGSIFKSIFSLFSGDKRKEKEIQRIQEQVDALQKSYDALGDSIEKAYSTDAKALIEDQNKMIEQQNALIRNQIAEEEAKKDTDWDRINEWNARIEENNKLIEENKEKAIDAIFGEDLKSAIENFATAYADAWAQGEDKAESAKDTVRKMMRQMVTESIKAAIQSSGAMEKIRKKLEEFYADNVLSGWEQDYIYNMAEDLQKELDRQFGWADSLMKDEKETSQQATSKGYQAMSQDTGNELNGKFSVMTDIMAKQLELQKVMKDASLAGVDATFNIRDLVSAANGHLQAIRNNTNELYDIRRELKTIRENTAYLK